MSYYLKASSPEVEIMLDALYYHWWGQEARAHRTLIQLGKLLTSNTERTDDGKTIPPLQQGQTKKGDYDDRAL